MARLVTFIHRGSMLPVSVMQLSTFYRYTYNRYTFETVRRTSDRRGGCFLAGASAMIGVDRATTLPGTIDSHCRSRCIPEARVR
jgi:hypothetical protein